MMKAKEKNMLAVLNRLSAVVAVAFTLLTASSLALLLRHEHQESINMARLEAMVVFGKDQTLRKWAAKHGGVYVPATEDTPPNPYLSHIPERDITTAQGKHLTLMNPAYMIRQIMADHYGRYGVIGHITSLKPVNPVNAPDEWQRHALESFDRGADEVIEVTRLEGKPYLRFMRPMITQEQCLKCHEVQGYKVGDVRGGVEVAVPMHYYLAYKKSNSTIHVLSHLFLWLLGMGVMAFGFIKGRSGILANLKVEELTHTLSAIVESSDDAVISWDLDGVVTSWNKSAEKILGYSAAEAVGKPVSTFFLSQKADLFPQAMETLRRGKTIEHHETEYSRKDGGKIFVSISISPIKNEAAGIVGVSAIARDITEHRRAEEQLRNSNRMLDEAQRIAHLGSWQLDLETNKLSWTDEIYRIFGLQPQEFGADYESFLEVVHPEDREYVHRAFMTSVEEDRPYDIEHRIVKSSSGETRYVQEKCEHIKNGSGKIVRSCGTVLDITERKKAEKDLAERIMLAELAADVGNALTMPGKLPEVLQRCTEAFVRHLGAAFARIWVFNEKENCLDLQASAGMYTHVNGRHARIKPGEFKIGTIGLERRACLTNNLLGDPHIEDQEWVRKEGLQSFAGHPLIVGERLVGVMGMFSREPFTGITLKVLSSVADEIAIGIEHKLSEEELLKLSSAVDQSPATILITDVKGDIEFVNPRFTQVTGYSPEEVRGRSTRILKSGNTPPEVYQGLWSTITAGKVWHGELQNKKKNGEFYFEAVTISPIKNREGVITHFVAIKEDITERRRLEEQLRHSQKMEAIGLLAGGIAHDFNNMLTVIIGYGGVLQMAMAPDHPLLPNVDRILLVAERAAGLTSSLLAFSRKQATRTEPVNLNSIIRKVEKFLARIIGEDIKIQTALGSETLITNADSGQMEQVLMNLATNARDAMPRGGIFSIATDFVAIDEAFINAHGYGEPGPYALVSVTDTGEGMDAATASRVFEPFFTTKEVGKGTGLGLSIVYGIIKQHNGYITLYSEPGRGTTFRIYLPLTDAAALVQGQAPSAPPRRGSETILLAEDDAEVRDITKNILTEFGYTVIEAVDGEDALNKYLENRSRIQLLLLDMIMPKKNGKMVYHEIRAAGSEVRVIFLSGYPPDMIFKNVMLDRGVELLMKPVSPQNLLRKIREVMERSTP